MSLYALNLFDLEVNDLYLRYSRHSPEAVAKHGGRVVALGRLEEALESELGIEPRTVMVLVEWPSTPSSTIPISKISTPCERAGPVTICGGPTSASKT